MNTMPISLCLVRCAIVRIDVANPLVSIAIFQYNSDTLTRTLQVQTSGGESGNHASGTIATGQ